MAKNSTISSEEGFRSCSSSFCSSPTDKDEIEGIDSHIRILGKVEGVYLRNICFWFEKGVKNRDGKIIRKAKERFSFPWKDVIQHEYSSDYVRSLLSEMTPHAVTETEEYVIVAYSPAKLIGGSDIAKLVNEKFVASKGADSFNQSLSESPPPPHTPSNSDPVSPLSTNPSPGIFEWVRKNIF